MKSIPRPWARCQSMWQWKNLHSLNQHFTSPIKRRQRQGKVNRDGKRERDVPNTRIIRHEPQHHVSPRRYNNRIPPRRVLWEIRMILRIIRNRISIRQACKIRPVTWFALHNLEVMAMEMERVRTTIVVIKHDLHDI